MYSFLRIREWKYKAVTLSYDDGTIFDRKLIEILDKYGLMDKDKLEEVLNPYSMT